MKTYKFTVSLCGGWCSGYLEFEAENEDKAYDMAMNHVAYTLAESFPTLDIDYYVECENSDDEEQEAKIIRVKDSLELKNGMSSEDDLSYGQAIALLDQIEKVIK